MRSASRRLAFTFTAAITLAAAWSAACGESGEPESVGGLEGDGGPGALPDATVNGKDAEAALSTVRIAHLADGLGAVDFCYRTAKSSAFVGPVIGRGIGGPKRDAGADGGDAGDDGGDDAAPDASTPDGGLPAIAPRTVTRYLSLEAAGALTVVLVAPGATSCATALASGDVTLDPGKLSTVAIVGRAGVDGGAEALAMVGLVDDRTTVAAKARVRMFHAALGSDSRAASPALAARAVGAQTHTLADRVEPRKAGSSSTAAPLDALGYAAIAPVPAPAQLAIGAAAGLTGDASVEGWVSEPGDLGLIGGSLHTGFVLTGGQAPYEILWCTDTSTSGDLTTCKVVR